VLVNNDCLIFNGMKENITAARYHSLIVEEESLPDELVVTARTASGEIMGLQHKKYPVYGIQFHPESIMTPDGTKMLENFLKIGGESDDKKYNCKAG
jgi:anthranilate/para-aminobenzoate synthase component II